MMGSDPPLVVIGAMRRPDGSRKDTAANAIETAEFVVNLVTEDDVKVMNFTCIDAPPGFDEAAAAGLVLTPSLAVAPPRIATAPVSLECRLFEAVRPGPRQIIVIGEVLHAHIDDRFILDAERFHLDTLAMKLIARVHGAGWYARTTDLFQMERPSFAAWSKARAEAGEG
jgi:flavin reductase (DIM6/NTAB) family NADH-FMN oxidoreductase RutF